ncbi:MAG: GIY-YIG nuclease family protein [Candidatus Portnoybacteria bacterium]|nr:GIY-YIG nuclease family protein [Candidatus Portnoybacteria bacterium]
MYFVYILRSLKNYYIYIGSTEDVCNRLNLHNRGRVKSTKAYRPWQLLEKQEFNTRSEAVKRERFLKTHQQKEILKKKYGQVAKW